MSYRVFRFISFAVGIAAVFGAPAPAQNGKNTATVAAPSPARAAEAFQAAVKQGPAALRNFLLAFPKGADLHVHLSGAVFAETLIRDAGEDGACVDKVALTLAKPPCTGDLIPARDLSGNIDREHQLLYDKLIDALSIRSFVPSPSWSTHDQFFSVFDRLGALADHTGEWVDEVAGRAAAQNNQYLELMITPGFAHAAQTAGQLAPGANLGQATQQVFAQFRQQLLDRGLTGEVQSARDLATQGETARMKTEQCGTQQAAPACQVEVRFIFQVLRDLPPEQVFAQLLLGFETVHASLAAKDDTWVGINMVRPEDDFVSMRDYTLHMKMVGYLHSVYPDVPISLHAGELAYGLVPPEGLTFHIRQAVEIAGARRIGHGVDVMYEDKPEQLMKELVQKHVMVEINLSSNEAILGVSGKDHPFPAYLNAKVPIALSTDDEGVSRIDLTHEYERAVLDYNLTYDNLKKLARTGMEHSFLPGASLWPFEDHFEASVKECGQDSLGGASPSAACKAFLDSSEKATAQWELEKRFAAFEAEYVARAKARAAKEKAEDSGSPPTSQ
jgi:adenosine deaminase